MAGTRPGPIARLPVRAARAIPRLVAIPLLLLQALLALSTCYLLTLLAAALRRPAGTLDSPGPPDRARLRFIILIPAHDEEAGLGATLESVAALDYPRDRFEAVVIADNCGDRTAEVARAAGATVLERTDPARRGKGYALAWALVPLLRQRPDVDAFAFLDADCSVTANLLTALEARLRAGATAVQADYVVANPAESWAAGLRYAAFRLINTVRPLGKDRLGLSCGLLGTGMGFDRALLARHPWEAFSIIEDGEYHLRLVAAGERVVFAPEAAVRSTMPTSLGASREQQLRHEGGRLQLIRAWTPALLRAGLPRRDPVRVHAALEPLVPPQSLHFAVNGALALLALALPGRAGRRARALAAANVLGQAAYVLGGLLLVRAPVAAYRSLALAPALVLWKLGLYARIAAGRGPTQWVRTDRVAGRGSQI